MYLGLPLGALWLARHGHVPRVICLGHPEAPGRGRVLRRLASRGSLVLGRPDLHDPDVFRVLEEARPDAILSFFWPRKIPPEVLALAPRGAFGTHPSLLPRWRGPDPYFWAIDAGDAETGVTLHRLEAEYDTGAILAQRRIALEPRWNAWKLARALDRPALSLLVECADALARGEALEGRPQPLDGVTEAPRPDDEAMALDWHASAEEVVRRVRACAPYPGASAELDGTYVEVVEAAVCDENGPRALEVAEAFETRDGRVAVRCGAGAVVLCRVRDAEGEEVDPLGLLGLE